MMPLVSDFMAIAAKLNRFSDRAGLEFLEAIGLDFGYTRSRLLESVNIEELLTLAACDVAWESVTAEYEPTGYSLPRAMGALATVHSLEHLIAGVLFEIQSEVFQQSCSLHDRLAAKMKDGDSVISYNYDLLIDRALIASDRMTIANYGIDFAGAIAGANFGPAELSTLPTEPPASIQLLKLHGSLNWLQISHEELDSSKEFMTSEHPIILLRDAFNVWIPPGNFGRSFHLERSDYEPGRVNNVTLSNVIVPPTFDKAEVWRERGGRLRRLWSKAREALAACDRLVVIGHSLREADYQTRWLLRVGLAQRNPTREVVLVNPCEADRSRLAEFFDGLGIVRSHSGVEEFLAANSPG